MPTTRVERVIYGASRLTEHDIYLFRQGTHTRLYEKLGAHPGTVNAVELLQFGIYRGIGLTDWYHMLNAGYRFPCVGASDFPACRFLADCRTYAHPARTDSAAKAARPTIADWIRGAAQGRSFVTTGPLVALEVDGVGPGETLRQAPGRTRWTSRCTTRSRSFISTPVRILRSADSRTTLASGSQPRSRMPSAAATRT